MPLCKEVKVLGPAEPLLIIPLAQRVGPEQWHLVANC